MSLARSRSRARSLSLSLPLSLSLARSLARALSLALALALALSLSRPLALSLSLLQSSVPLLKGSHGWKTINVWTSGSVYSGRSIPSLEGVEEALTLDLSDALRLATASSGSLNEDGVHAVVKKVLRELTAKKRQRHRQAAVVATYNSALMQDAWVVVLFEGMRGGFFVDLAAFDAVQHSNTLALERDYGWQVRGGMAGSGARTFGAGNSRSRSAQIAFLSALARNETVRHACL